MEPIFDGGFDKFFNSLVSDGEQAKKIFASMSFQERQRVREFLHPDSCYAQIIKDFNPPMSADAKRHQRDREMYHIRKNYPEKYAPLVERHITDRLNAMKSASLEVNLDEIIAEVMKVEFYCNTFQGELSGLIYNQIKSTYAPLGWQIRTETLGTASISIH